MNKRLYLGLNDAKTKKQIKPTNDLKNELSNVFVDLKIGATITDAVGVWQSEKEKTLIIDFYNITKAQFKNITKTLLKVFNQCELLSVKLPKAKAIKNKYI